MAIGAAWSGYGGWGCGWGNNEININVSKQNNFTKNNYNRPEQHQRTRRQESWKHNPEHRGGAQYPNQATAQKYGQQRSGPGAGQPPQTPEGTAVAQGREVAEGLKPATSVVARGERRWRPTSDLSGGRRALWVDLAGEEANVRPAIEARRAAVLLPGAAWGIPQQWRSIP